MTTGAGTGETDKRREEIQKTRAELGETARALAANTDPKALGRETAARAKARVREQAAQTTDTVRESAVRLPMTVGQKALQGTKAISQKTLQSTRTARQKGERGVEAARNSAYRAGSKIRRHPAASATIAAAIITVWSLQRRRKNAVP